MADIQKDRIMHVEISYRPVIGCYLFNVKVIEMVLHKLNTGIEVCSVKLVWDVPPQWTELACQCEENNDMCNALVIFPLNMTLSRYRRWDLAGH